MPDQLAIIGPKTLWAHRPEKKPPDFGLRGFFVPENVVPKVRVELTQGHPYRFLSLVRVVLIRVLRRDVVQPPEYFHASVRD